MLDVGASSGWSITGPDNNIICTLGINANAGPFIRGNIFYCSDWFCYEGDHSKTVFRNNTVYTTPSVWEVFQAQLCKFGAASGNVLNKN